MSTHRPHHAEPTLSALLRQASTAVCNLTLTKEEQRPRYPVVRTWHYAPEQSSALALSNDQAEAEAMFQALAATCCVPHLIH
jgi:hypothetical protein